MGRHPKYLQPEDVPEEYRDLLDYDSQRLLVRYGKSALYINAKCADCDKKRILQVYSVRKKLKVGKFTGFCKKCMVGEKGSYYKKGWWQGNKGYIFRSIGAYKEYEDIIKPMAPKGGVIMEHRAIMAIHLGRSLDSRELVRHLNGNKTDNRIENLAVGTHADNSKDHHDTYLELLALRKDYEFVAEKVAIINEELGGVEKLLGETRDHVSGINGELKWIRYVIIGTFLAAITDLLLGFLSG
ncbi:hypothetical protein LCGC14_1189370 [marine sediment metagenome]|uniref:HNH nuclease domain-containing protein n=1 Tax=marine sediment metagenome TaxID=412755 RepID=A0A0F9LK14_9ZZZZ